MDQVSRPFCTWTTADDSHPIVDPYVLCLKGELTVLLDPGQQADDQPSSFLIVSLDLFENGRIDGSGTMMISKVCVGQSLGNSPMRSRVFSTSPLGVYVHC